MLLRLLNSIDLLIMEDNKLLALKENSILFHFNRHTSHMGMQLSYLKVHVCHSEQLESSPIHHGLPT